MNIIKFRGTHTQQLERWLGSEALQALHEASRDFYYPIPVANVPGGVQAYRGDFFGEIRGGAGFTSLSDLINEATVNGKAQYPWFSKISGAGAAGQWFSLFNVATFPAAGGTPAAIAAGAVPTNAAAGGGLPFVNAAGGDTLHITTVSSTCSAGVPATLLLYDRIFHASAVAHNTTGNQAVSGVPNRYATTTSPGNFAFLEVTNALGSTAHTITMTYQDQDGNIAEAAPALAAVASSAANRLPHAPWFVPLNAADSGLRNVTNLAMSAVSSGTSNVVMGHPLVFIPQLVNNAMVVMDGINSAFNLIQVLDSACLCFIQLNGGNATYTGQVTMVSG